MICTQNLEILIRWSYLLQGESMDRLLQRLETYQTYRVNPHCSVRFLLGRDDLVSGHLSFFLANLLLHYLSSTIQIADRVLDSVTSLIPQREDNLWPRK